MNYKIKVTADANIPFLKGVLEPYCEMKYIPGKEIAPADCADADALIVRTRTRCNEALLKDSKVSFIASATIGTDHVDLDYLSRRGIDFANAPGCNAFGVMQYVHTALMLTALRKKIDLRGKVLGVVGDGNTGERVARLAEMLGFKVLSNDIDMSKPRPIVPLEDLLKKSDIVSFHLPLDASTEGLIDRKKIEMMKDGAIFINASRGQIMDEKALLDNYRRFSALILDVWQREPSGINKELVSAADIATPHIAGYSFEGKINGTTMAVRAFARHFGIKELLDFEPEHTPTPVIPLPLGFLAPHAGNVSGSGPDYWETLETLVKNMLDLFPLDSTDALFRSSVDSFEKIRNEYNYRREFKI